MQGVGRDGDINSIEKFVCQLYGVHFKSNVNDARMELFGKGKNSLDMVPQQEMLQIQLHADQKDFVAASLVDTAAWKNNDGCLEIVWTRLLPIPVACIELVTCGCKLKCKTARCSCFKGSMQCANACDCDAINCSNPAGQIFDHIRALVNSLNIDILLQ